jgi:purine nucleoside permease
VITENSKWFEVVPENDAMTLALLSPIPPAVVANNQQLVFVITAQRPGSSTARATIVIVLTDGNYIHSIHSSVFIMSSTP